MPKYSETHHLNIDDTGLASVHVTVHLQNVNPQIAHLFVLRVLDAASAVAAVPEQGVPGQIIRPQTSGPCVHYDERSEHVADVAPCTYPYEDGCPHLDNPDVLCPVKDACYAQVCSLCGYYDERSEYVDNIDPCTHPDACEGGCPYLDDDGIYCPQKEELAWALGDDIPKFVPLTQDPEGWGTDMVAEAPDTIPRSDYVPAPEDPQAQVDDAGKSEPEFVEPELDEAAIRRPRFKVGDKVRISHPTYKGYTGTIRRYYAATENYLLTIDGTRDTIWLSEQYLEVGA